MSLGKFFDATYAGRMQKTSNRMQYHSLERTSPKGQDFLGTCKLCGVMNLRIEDCRNYCENVRGLTNEEAILEAVRGPSGRIS